MNLARSFARKEIEAIYAKAEKQYRRAGELYKGVDIGGDTFRAFRQTGVSPSVVVKEWHKDCAFELIESHKMTSREDFLRLHNKLILSLDERWNGVASRPLTVAEKCKVVDLLIKALAFSSGHSCDSCRRDLFVYGNIPLDKYSLGAIGRLFYGLVICDNPRMGLITEFDTYEFLQSQVYDFMSGIGIPNLVFDYYAWDNRQGMP